MTNKGHRTGDQLSSPVSRQEPKSIPARQFPILQQIQELQVGLSALNERIAELEKQDHRGHAMEVLKANAMDFACQIDELRGLLIDAAPQTKVNCSKRLSKV